MLEPEDLRSMLAEHDGQLDIKEGFVTFLRAIYRSKPDFASIVESAEIQRVAQHLQEVLLEDTRLILLQKKKAEVYEAIGGDEHSPQWEVFQRKREMLERKWRYKEDSEDRRLIWDTLSRELKNLDPVCVAILCDNPLFVEKNLAMLDQENCLNMACLFGSRNTAEYLMRKLNISDFKYDGGRLFASMCLSFNVGWVKEVFEGQLHSKRPLLVDLDGLEEEIRKIVTPPRERSRLSPM